MFLTVTSFLSGVRGLQALDLHTHTDYQKGPELYLDDKYWLLYKHTSR